MVRAYGGGACEQAAEYETPASLDLLRWRTARWRLVARGYVGAKVQTAGCVFQGREDELGTRDQMVPQP